RGGRGAGRRALRGRHSAHRAGAAGSGRAAGRRQPGTRRKREFGRFAAIQPWPLMKPREPSSGSACTRILKCNTVTEPILLVAASSRALGWLTIAIGEPGCAAVLHHEARAMAGDR